MLIALNTIGVVALIFILVCLVLGIFAYPLANLWYYLNEVQDEKDTDDTGAGTIHRPNMD